MRNFKKTLILSAAGLILIGAAVAALTLIPPKEEEPEATPTPSEQPRGALVDESTQTVKSVTFTPAEGKSFTIVITDGAHDMLEKTDVFSYSEVYLASTADFAFSQPNALIITENATADQLSDFGFDKPQLRWRVDRTDGTYAEFELGGMNATQDSYYAREAGGGTVCAISASAGRAMLKKEHEYYELKLIRTYVDEDYQQLSLADTMTYLRLEKADGEALEFQKRTDEELEGAGIGVSSFMMLSPYSVEANDYQVGELLAAKIQTISPSKTLGSIDDPAKYGLDRPARLEIRDQEGWSTVFLIGGVDPDTSGRYLTVEGSRYVLLDTIGDYSFLNVNPLSLRSSLVWLVDIKTVSEVTYYLDGVTRVLKLDITEETEYAELDGTEIIAINGKRLYTRTLELMIDGVDETSPPGPVQYEIIMKLRDGGQRTMRLYRLNDRQYKIELDGKIEPFYVGIARINKLLEGFDIVDSGGEIPWS